MSSNQQLVTSSQTPPTSPRFVRGLLANLRYWQAQTAVINDDIIRDLEPDFPNVVQAVEMGLVLAETWRETAVLILQCFFWVEGSGRVPQWRPLLEKCLAIMPAPDDWLEFRLLKQLGQFQRIQWDLDTAVNTFNRAGEIVQTMQNDQAIAEIHMNLGQTYQRQHRYTEAEVEGAKALALFTEAQLRLKVVTLQSMGYLAKERGNLPLAEARLKEAIELLHGSNDVSNTDITRTMNALALIYQEQKKYEPAQQLYQEVAALLVNTTKEEDKIRSAINQGSLFYSWEKFDQAETAFRQAEQMLQQQKGMFPLKALVANNLGCVLRHQRDWLAAEHYQQRSIRLYRQLEDGLMLATAVGNLAKLYMQQGIVEKALNQFEKALALASQFPENAWAKSQIVAYTEKRAELRQRREKIGAAG